MLTHPIDPLVYKDSNEDSNHDFNRANSLEKTQEKCGSFIDFDECVARKTMETLKDVMT